MVPVPTSTGRSTGVAALAVAVGIVAASASDANANDATMQVNNTSGFTLTLKEKGVSNPHSRFDMVQNTIPPGFNGAAATASSAWPYTIDPLLIYSIGDTGKTIRIQASQGSPWPSIDTYCTFPDGQPPGISCAADKAFGVDYTARFRVGG